MKHTIEEYVDNGLRILLGEVDAAVGESTGRPVIPAYQLPSNLKKVTKEIQLLTEKEGTSEEELLVIKEKIKKTRGILRNSQLRHCVDGMPGLTQRYESLPKSLRTPELLAHKEAFESAVTLINEKKIWYPADISKLAWAYRDAICEAEESRAAQRARVTQQKRISKERAVGRRTIAEQIMDLVGAQ
ncbi:MAG: hypothetical protein V4690_00415 [Patescibacteria group bacterium]